MNLSTRLSNVQLELLKLYSTDLSPDDLHDLKLQLARFYANRAIKVADRLAGEKNYSNDLMESWLDEE